MRRNDWNAVLKTLKRIVALFWRKNCLFSRQDAIIMHLNVLLHEKGVVSQLLTHAVDVTCHFRQHDAVEVVIHVEDPMSLIDPLFDVHSDETPVRVDSLNSFEDFFVVFPSFGRDGETRAPLVDEDGDGCSYRFSCRPECSKARLRVGVKDCRETRSC